MLLGVVYLAPACETRIDLAVAAAAGLAGVTRQTSWSWLRETFPASITYAVTLAADFSLSGPGCSCYSMACRPMRGSLVSSLSLHQLFYAVFSQLSRA
jgi:hypothetical protein